MITKIGCLIKISVLSDAEFADLQRRMRDAGIKYNKASYSDPNGSGTAKMRAEFENLRSQWDNARKERRSGSNNTTTGNTGSYNNQRQSQQQQQQRQSQQQQQQRQSQRYGSTQNSNSKSTGKAPSGSRGGSTPKGKSFLSGKGKYVIPGVIGAGGLYAAYRYLNRDNV